MQQDSIAGYVGKNIFHVQVFVQRGDDRDVTIQGVRRKMIHFNSQNNSINSELFLSKYIL